MNVDRGKTSFTEEEVVELRDRTAALKADNGYSWEKMRQLTGVPVGTLSQWVPGNYAGDNAAVAERIHKFFLKEEAQRALFTKESPIPGFQATKTAKRITTVLRWALRGKMVTVVGEPGTGKTAVLDQFAATTPDTWKVTIRPSNNSTNAVLLSILHAMGGVRTGGSGFQLAKLITERVQNRSALLMIDEAQTLSEGAIEELRGLHDATGVGLALVGNADVQHRVERSAAGASFAQRHSRISMRHVIDKPEVDDIEALLDAWGITDTTERSFMRNIALKAGGGGLRALTHTLELATILAQQSDDEPRVLDHLQAARAQLVSTRSAA